MGPGRLRRGVVRGVVRGGRDGVRMGLCVRKGLYWASNGLHTNIGPRELDPMRKQRGREQRLVTQVRRTAFVEARIVPCKTKRIQLHTHTDTDRHRQTQTHIGKNGRVWHICQMGECEPSFLE